MQVQVDHFHPSFFKAGGDVRSVNAAENDGFDFLIRHHIALWDVLASCEISGAADSSIKNAVPNNFHEILIQSKIKRVFCTGKIAFALWKKYCTKEYEERYSLIVECLPSTSPANAACSLEKLIEAYKVIHQGIRNFFSD